MSKMTDEQKTYLENLLRHLKGAIAALEKLLKD